jgi:hypothetical protein
MQMQPLSAINHVIDRLEHGEVAARVALESEAWAEKTMSTSG